MYFLLFFFTKNKKIRNFHKSEQKQHPHNEFDCV
jgi:hypothetical protein